MKNVARPSLEAHLDVVSAFTGTGLPDYAPLLPYSQAR